MKKLFCVFILFLSPLLLTAQDLRPKVVVDGIEMKIGKCEGDLSKKLVNVEIIFTNVGEFDKTVYFANLAFSGPEGEQFMPVGEYTAYMWEGLTAKLDLISGVPRKTNRIVIKDVSPRFKYFSGVTVNQTFHPKDNSYKAKMTIKNIPIEWK